MRMEKAYSTESKFKNALARYTKNGELCYWYGGDHGWIIVIQKERKRK